jgi:hypothetical protein
LGLAEPRSSGSSAVLGVVGVAGGRGMPYWGSMLIALCDGRNWRAEWWRGGARCPLFGEVPMPVLSARYRLARLGSNYLVRGVRRGAGGGVLRSRAPEPAFGAFPPTSRMERGGAGEVLPRKQSPNLGDSFAFSSTSTQLPADDQSLARSPL